MVSDKRCKLMLLVDYLLTVVLSLFGLFLFSWLFQYSWGSVVYSVLFTLVFFGLVYSRCWKKAKSDLKYQKEKASPSHAMRLILPLAAVLLAIVAVFVLIKYNIIPVRDIVTDVRYILEENQPRQKQTIVVFDSVVLVMRMIFPFLTGFHPAGGTSTLVFLIAPAVSVLAGALGYFAGLKKFYLSEIILKTQQKAKDKFNE